MQLKGEAYSRRLDSYSDNTLRLILSFTEKERALKATQIASDSELTEEQVVERLKALKKSVSKKTDSK